MGTFFKDLPRIIDCLLFPCSAVLAVGEKKFRTQYLKNESDPVWNEVIVLGNEFKPTDSCRLEVWDKDFGEPSMNVCILSVLEKAKYSHKLKKYFPPRNRFP